MIIPVLKWLHSPDIDLDTYYPEDPGYFGFLLQAFFGIEGEKGKDSFDILVCTPRWLQSNDLWRNGGILIGRHYLLMETYSIDQIRRFINDYAKNCAGKTWNEVAIKLGRLGKWEYEDYYKLPSKLES